MPEKFSITYRSVIECEMCANRVVVHSRIGFGEIHAVCANCGNQTIFQVVDRIKNKVAVPQVTRDDQGRLVNPKWN